MVQKHGYILKILRNKFFLTTLIFIVWISVFDENNLLERRKLGKELRQLEKDKKFFKNQIAKDAARLKELQTNDENLEKFAREQYLMHRDNEDVFIVVED